MIIESEHELSEIVRSLRSVAVVGMKDEASASEPAYTIPKVLHARGIRVIPVNPKIASSLGLKALPNVSAFNEGHRYLDFNPSLDKVATYGIGALIAGKVAAKVGLFKVIIAGLIAAKKIVIVAFVGVTAWVVRWLKRRKEAHPTGMTPPRPV